MTANDITEGGSRAGDPDVAIVALMDVHDRAVGTVGAATF
jgi:hypothetical protein